MCLHGGKLKKGELMKTLVKIFLVLVLWCNVSYAQPVIVKELVVDFPLTVTTSEDKTAFLYKAQEELRLLHNQMGDDFRNGIITEKQWQDFLQTVFNPKQEAISIEIIKARDFFKKDTKYTVDLENDFKEKTP